MENMFSFCSSLISLPDISNWDTKKVTNMKKMFYQCSSLNILPDLSKWNITKVNDMEDMFIGCVDTLNVPPKFLI